jgi:serine/threonine-protein kinase
MAILAPGTVLQGRYRIERLLGQGGMSQVFLATHLKLKKPVAVKRMLVLTGDSLELRKMAEQFESEAQILASLDHPNLAAVLDCFDDGTLPYLVMELVGGRDLEQIVELAPRPLSERKVLEWTRQLLDVLEYLHGHQPPVIVRDLKPSNIMLGPDGRLRLIDFGLARFLTPGSRTSAIVKGMGSQGFAPLEQYGRGTTDQRSDIYALGATMLFLLTDHPPPEAATRLMKGVDLPDPRQVNPTVSERTWHGVRKMLALYPQDRPASVAEVRSLLGLEPAPEGPPAPAGRSWTAVPEGSPAGRGRGCPVCGVPLRARHYLKVEVDVCDRCGGVWLDRGELHKIVERSLPGGRGSVWKRLLDEIL